MDGFDTPKCLIHLNANFERGQVMMNWIFWQFNPSAHFCLGTVKSIKLTYPLLSHNNF